MSLKTGTNKTIWTKFKQLTLSNIGILNKSCRSQCRHHPYFHQNIYHLSQGRRMQGLICNFAKITTSWVITFFLDFPALASGWQWMANLMTDENARLRRCEVVDGTRPWNQTRTQQELPFDSLLIPRKHAGPMKMWGNHRYKRLKLIYPTGILHNFCTRKIVINCGWTSIHTHGICTLGLRAVLVSSFIAEWNK